MTALTIGLIGMLAFLALVAMRMPIAIAMALAGFAGFSFMVSPQAAMNMVTGLGQSSRYNASAARI